MDELNLLLPFLGKCAKLLRMIVDLKVEGEDILTGMHLVPWPRCHLC